MKNVSTPTPTYKIEAFKPTILLTPTPTPVDPNFFLISLGMTINYNKYTVNLKKEYVYNSKNVPAVEISLVNYPSYYEIIQIISISNLEQEDLKKYIADYNRMYKSDSSIRPITIAGTRYSFNGYENGESLPEEDNPKCSSGGGAINNQVIIDEKIAISFRDSYSLRSCNGEPSKKEFILSASQRESLLQLIETIHLK